MKQTGDAPMRVAQVLNRMDSGGIEAVVMNYYRHIDRSQVQFDFYYDEGSTLPQKEELARLGAGLYPTPSYRHIVAYHRALVKAFRAGRYEIVHAHLSVLSVFALLAARRAGVPVRICHNHTASSWLEGGRTLLKTLLRPWNLLVANRYYACGEHAGRWMYGNRRFDRGEVTVMPNAIEAQAYAFDPEARSRLREALGIAQDAFVVGHVGRFVAQKNHAFLLKAFARLRELRADARLLLVGEGERMERIRRKAQALGIADAVIFTGARRDVNRLYSVMDVFCLPSLYEGMPVVSMEAQANGLPVICSDRVPAEAKMTDQMRQLPLGDAGLWADCLMQTRRTPGGGLPDGYDIDRAAGKLQEDYLRGRDGAGLRAEDDAKTIHAGRDVS